MSGTAWGAEGGTPACGIGAPKAQASGAARAATVERFAQRMTDSAEALRPSCPLDCRAWLLFPHPRSGRYSCSRNAVTVSPLTVQHRSGRRFAFRNPLWRAAALAACSLGRLLANVY